ncbi:MAG TPA: putative metal-dependent hydrolase [Pyrinomonadaceae bacterium]|nr:putative metal-dependent hydrolase [Pyrinomonadaceae bacterium]
MENDLRYPIGKFDREAATSRADHIKTIASLPENLKLAVADLSDEQLDTVYRPEGWTLRQTVHHLADSHINSLVRFKLALTEDEAPTIRPYYEDRWAELADSKMPVDVSLAIVAGVHRRWVNLLESMTDEDYRREFIHPETGPWMLEKVLALYAWHSLHHTAHITSTRERNGW